MAIRRQLVWLGWVLAWFVGAVCALGPWLWNLQRWGVVGP